MNKEHDYGKHPEDKNFSQARGWIKEKWGWLTDNDLLEMEGKTEKLLAKIQDHYGDRWEDEYNQFTREFPQYGYKDEMKRDPMI